MSITTIVCGVGFLVVFVLELVKILMGDPVDPLITLFVMVIWVMTAYFLGFSDGFISK